MAYEYQTDEDPYKLLGSKGEVNPEELSNAYFQNLDKALARQEGRQMERTLGDLGDRGFLRSGDTFTRVSEDVLGPAQERRNQLVLGEMKTAANQGREERLGAEQFDRQKEVMSLQNQYRLEEIQAQSNMQKMLMELEAELSGDQGSIWESIGGQALGSLAGSMTGAIGARMGNKVSNSLFGDNPYSKR